MSEQRPTLKKLPAGEVDAWLKKVAASDPPIVFLYQTDGEALAIRDDGWLIGRGSPGAVLDAAISKAQGGKVILGPGSWVFDELNPAVTYIGTTPQEPPHLHDPLTALTTMVENP